MTVGSGQLCTKPGLVAIPKGADGDALVAVTADALARRETHVLLNHGSYASCTARCVLCCPRCTALKPHCHPSGRRVTMLYLSDRSRGSPLIDDANVIPRRIDGELRLPSSVSP
jgi:hypothetical protein